MTWESNTFYFLLSPKLRKWRCTRASTACCMLKMAIYKIPYEPSFVVTSQNGLPYNTERIFKLGVLGGAVGWGTALQVGRSRVWFPMVLLEFFIDIILPAAPWPWGWRSLLRKWVPGIFPGGKGVLCVGPSCADCLEIWKPHTPETFSAYPGL